MLRPTTLTKHDIEQVFDGAASSYDRVGPPIFSHFAGHLVDQIPLTPGMQVLDIATGTGLVLLQIARRVGDEGRVSGIDLSEGILREAQKAVVAAGVSNVELRRMDAEHLQFPDGSFDVVTCAFALFMLPDIGAALHEMHRVCKPDGRVAVTYFMKVPPPFNPGWVAFAEQCTEYGIGMRMPQQLGLTPEELEGLLKKSGFHRVKTRSETYDIVYPTAEDWWGFMLTMGSRATILGMDEETRARFKEDYFTRLAPARHEDGYHVSTGIIYAVAKR